MLKGYIMSATRNVLTQTETRTLLYVPLTVVYA
jgi:hypothetical protein